MKSWLLHSVSAVLLGTSCLFAFPAYADHPWKDAPQSARITTDAQLENIQLTALTQHNALSLLGLDVDGRPVLIDSANQEHPFPENETERAKIPPLSALTKQDTIFGDWLPPQKPRSFSYPQAENCFKQFLFKVATPQTAVSRPSRSMEITLI